MFSLQKRKDTAFLCPSLLLSPFRSLSLSVVSLPMIKITEKCPRSSFPPTLYPYISLFHPGVLAAQPAVIVLPSLFTRHREQSQQSARKKKKTARWGGTPHMLQTSTSTSTKKNVYIYIHDTSIQQWKRGRHNGCWTYHNKHVPDKRTTHRPLGKRTRNGCTPPSGRGGVHSQQPPLAPPAPRPTSAAPCRNGEARGRVWFGGAGRHGSRNKKRETWYVFVYVFLCIYKKRENMQTVQSCITRMANRSRIY